MDSEAIKHMRNKLNMTQDEFASVLSVAVSTVSRYEAGSVKPSGDAEKRLFLLKKLMEDETYSQTIYETSQGEGGATRLAGLLALSAATLPDIANLKRFLLPGIPLAPIFAPLARIASGASAILGGSPIALICAALGANEKKLDE